MTLEEARSPASLLFECVAGSRAYGTDHAGSDVDLRGVFVAPQSLIYGLDQIEQVSDAKSDETYYEIGRFVELLAKNNPNILELLFMPAECVRFRSPLMDRIRPEMVLSKRCEATFAGYAMAQVRKAQGLNKKIVNPIDGPCRSALSFCYVIEGQGSVPLAEWLQERLLKIDRCGLVNVPHMRDLHAIFYDQEGDLGYRGIFGSEQSVEVLCSSVEREAEPIGWMQFNLDAYKRHVREHSEYQKWLVNRNESRYAANIAHGRNYDSKNLMHTFRLLAMASEIAREGLLRVRRSDAEELLRIKGGEYEYENLISRAQDEIEKIKELYAACDLPDRPDHEGLNQALTEIRQEHYARGSSIS